MTQPLQHQSRQMQQSHQHHPKPTAPHKAAAAAPVTLARKLGRQPRAFRNVPHYSAARMREGAAMNPLPQSVHWTKGMPNPLGFMLNGGTNNLIPGGQAVGDCPYSGGHHGREVWTFNATGLMVTDSDNCVLADYEAGGYDPTQTDANGNNPTDQGGVLQDVLTRFVKVGMTTEKGPDRLAGFYEVDPRNLHDIGRVIAEAGFAYIGISIPELWSQSNAGDTWDATSSPVEGGHCVILTGYELGGDGLPDWFDVISWGMSFRMTRAGFQQFCDEAYVLIDAFWIEKTGKSPAGLTLEQVKSDMQGIAA